MTTRDHSNHSFTRRRILGIGSVGAMGGLACYFGWTSSETLRTAVVSAPRKGLPASETEAPEITPSESAPAAGVLRREDFLPHLNSQFQFGTAGDTCRLVEVGDARKLASSTAEYVSFSLLFAASAGSVTDSKILPLSHAKLDTMELFISPVGQSEMHLYLEAVCCQRV